MNVAIGMAVLLITVFGGYLLGGGAMAPILHALPLEGMMIIGAAVGALFAGNSMHEVKAVAALSSAFSRGRSTTSRTISTRLRCAPS